MSGLSCYIERAGVATTSISLIREHSEALKPPRALWVPFPLGRPLGSADDPDFQLRVMRAAFGLLESATEPTIVDFPEEAPSTSGPGEWACPLNLPASDGDSASLTERLRGEVNTLLPWAQETRRTRGGRTLFGASGAEVEDIATLIAVFGALADGASPMELPTGCGAESVEWSYPMPFLIRHLADDLRIVYHEAVASRPGPRPPDHNALSHWIMDETVFGQALTAVALSLTAVGDKRLEILRGFLIPEGHFEGDHTFGTGHTDPAGILDYLRRGAD